MREKAGSDMAGAARRPLVAGNWKMNGLSSSQTELARIIQGARELAGLVELMVCPPATLLARFAVAARGTEVRIGAQDCHAEPAGAFTGDLSAEMLKDAGAVAVIVGHSERRTYHRETDADVRAKALAAWRAGLCAIVCVGESRAEREDGRAVVVVGTQIDGSVPDSATVENLVIAYEPVWAIGTGLTPTPGDVAEMHGHIRQRVVSRFGERGQGIRILYGGSVKPSNAKELMSVADVDGALVGGASLKADEFLAIASVYR
jgi:triosephosphate isomerase